jgi:CheY-like chemotaxis protein
VTAPAPATVGLADDVAELRMLLRRVLEMHGGFEVVAEAGDGVEARQAVAAHQPDVVLLDLAMPRCDGLQAIPELRRASPRTLVVVLSGFQAGTAAAALAQGAHSYVEKGLPTRELVAHLRALLAGRAAGAAAEDGEDDDDGPPAPGAVRYRPVRDRFGGVVDFWVEGEGVTGRLLRLAPGLLGTRLFDGYRRAVDTGEPFVERVRLDRPDGPVACEVRATPDGAGGLQVGWRVLPAEEAEAPAQAQAGEQPLPGRAQRARLAVLAAVGEAVDRTDELLQAVAGFLPQHPEPERGAAALLQQLRR